MPFERRHLRIPAAIALVALAVFVVLWIGARTELARGMVARAISDSIGLPATIESLQLGFFPSPSADIGGLAIAQPPGFGDEPFLTVGRLRLSLPWGRLFSRNTLNSVDITEATARLDRRRRRRRQLVEDRRRIAGSREKGRLVHRRARP